MRALTRLDLLIWATATVAGAAWALSRHPFAHPFISRTADEARIAIEAALAREVTPGWLVPRPRRGVA